MLSPVESIMRSKQLEAVPVTPLRERHQRLCFQPEPIVGEGFAQGADQHHVLVAANDALVGFFIGFDPAPAAILGGLAGDLGSGQRMGERILRRSDARHPEARGDVEVLAVNHMAETRDAVAERFRQLRGGIQGAIADEDREAIT